MRSELVVRCHFLNLSVRFKGMEADSGLYIRRAD
jgi:hypothetical protein